MVMTGKSDVAPITETERLVLGWGRYASHHLQLMNELVSSTETSSAREVNIRFSVCTTQLPSRP